MPPPGDRRGLGLVVGVREKRVVLAWSSRLRDLPAVALEGDAVRSRATAYAGVQRVDRGKLILRELEAKDIEVLGDARWSLLFDVSAADPLIYAAVSVLLAAVALAAVAVPASRATRIDPLAALRDS